MGPSEYYHSRKQFRIILFWFSSLCNLTCYKRYRISYTLLFRALIPFMTFFSPQDLIYSELIPSYYQQGFLESVSSFQGFSLIDFIKLYIFLCCPHFFSPPLQPSPMVHMLPIYSGDLVFFYLSRRLDLHMSLLVSSLLSRFSGIVICGLVFFALCLKTAYE